MAVNSSGTLGGGGTVNGAITLNASGNLDPGGTVGAVGTLTAAAVTMNAASSFTVQIGATADRLTTAGAANISLNGATLIGSLISGFVAGSGNTYDIVTATGTGRIVGTFAGLTDGVSVNIGGELFTITYVGGVGTATAVRLIDQNSSVAIPSTVYVNDDWAGGTIFGADADGAGAGLLTGDLDWGQRLLDHPLRHQCPALQRWHGRRVGEYHRLQLAGERQQERRFPVHRRYGEPWDSGQCFDQRHA